MSPMSPTNTTFDVTKFLAIIGKGRSILRLRKKQTIYAQGAPSDALFYIQKGEVKLTVVSKVGKEATIGILNQGDFFGEGALAGQPRRMGSAAALTDGQLMRIEKDSMIRTLHREHTLSDLFLRISGQKHPV